MNRRKPAIRRKVITKFAILPPRRVKKLKNEKNLFDFDIDFDLLRAGGGVSHRSHRFKGLYLKNQ